MMFGSILTLLIMITVICILAIFSKQFDPKQASEEGVRSKNDK